MRRIAVRGIAMSNGKLLCTKLRPYNNLVEPGAEWWCLPGGTVEQGEDITEALVREFCEETGIVPVIGRLLYVHQFVHKDTEHLEFFFRIENPEDFLFVDLSKTTHGKDEVEVIDYRDLKNTVVLPSFLINESLNTNADLNKSVKFFFSKE